MIDQNPFLSVYRLLLNLLKQIAYGGHLRRKSFKNYRTAGIKSLISLQEEEEINATIKTLVLTVNFN